MRLIFLIILPIFLVSFLFSGGFNTLKKVRPTPIPTPQNTYIVKEATSSGNPNTSGSDGSQSLQLKTVKFDKHTPQPSAAVCAGQKLAVDLLLDTSGSMCGSDLLIRDCTKLRSLQEAVKIFGGKLKPDDLVGVQQFSSPEILGGSGAQIVLPFGEYEKSNFEARINALNGDGNTHMRSAFLFARPLIEGAIASRPDYKPVLIFFSDGNPNPYPAQDPRAAVTEMKNALPNLTLITVGLQMPALGYQILRDIASTPTDFHPTVTPTELENIYEQIANQLCRN